MLLARIAAELRNHDELSERLLPVRFMEESQEIFNAGDFWLESLFYLAREQGTMRATWSRCCPVTRRKPMRCGPS